MNQIKLYKDYSDFLSELFPGRKMQKLTVNARFSCPNRDGSKGRGGCIYCNNVAFNPSFADAILPVSQQLEKGKEFFARKYPSMRYLAYFQAYTNTYGKNIDELLALYNEAFEVDGVDGIIIGTRPDCMSQELLEALKEINDKKGPVMIEYGAESSFDETLERINRCHTWADTVDAVRRTTEVGLHAGLHLILGLPGETRQMMLETVEKISQLPISTVKFHQLQIIEGTPLARMYREGSSGATIFTVDEYLQLCAEIISRIRPDIAIERFTSQSPDNLLIAPRWGLKNYEFVNKLRNLISQNR